MHVWVPHGTFQWQCFCSGNITLSVMATRRKRHGTFIRHTFLPDSPVALPCCVRNMLGVYQSKGIGDHWMFHAMYIYIYIHIYVDSIHTFRYSSPHKVWKIMEVDPIHSSTAKASNDSNCLCQWRRWVVEISSDCARSLGNFGSGLVCANDASLLRLPKPLRWDKFVGFFNLKHLFGWRSIGKPDWKEEKMVPIRQLNR